MVVILDRKLRKEINRKVEKQMKEVNKKLDKEVSEVLGHELTSKQEDDMIEAGMEDLRERRECELCGEKFDEEEMDLVKIGEEEGDRGYSSWVCRNCEESLKNE